MDTKTILNEATGRMQKAIDHLEEELLNVRAGKASTISARRFPFRALPASPYPTPGPS